MSSSLSRFDHLIIVSNSLSRFELPLSRFELSSLRAGGGDRCLRLHAWPEDGADEEDPDWNLIKGGGGALLNEKIVAASSVRYVIIIDDSKLVKRLGERGPIPVEIIPSSLVLVKKRLNFSRMIKDWKVIKNQKRKYVLLLKERKNIMNKKKREMKHYVLLLKEEIKIRHVLEKEWKIYVVLEKLSTKKNLQLYHFLPSLLIS